MAYSDRQSICVDNRRFGQRAGFTLLEVLVAVTIFSIIAVAIYSTFRVGMKSYSAGREHMEIIQSGRVVFNTISRDLRSLYYLPPDRYNQNLIRARQMRDMQLMQTNAIPGARDLQRGMRGRGRRGAEEGEDERIPGLPIDLAMIGSDGDKLDSLTFVTYQVNWGAARVSPWALARVKYWVQDGVLYRSEGPIWVDEIPSSQYEPPRDPEAEDDAAWEAEEPSDPGGDVNSYLKEARADRIAENVEVFDLEFGYWGEDGWFQTPEWSSNGRKYRRASMDFDPLDPRAQVFRMQQRNQPTDDIPAYVTLTLKLSYGGNDKATQLFRTRIRLPNSQETFIPLETMPGMRPPGDGGSRPATGFGFNPGQIRP